MSKLRPLVKIHGGKSYLYEWVIDKFPANYTSMKYGESCIGGGTITLNKLRSETEVINDLDGRLVNLYRQLISNGDAFLARLAEIEYSEDNFNWARNYEQTDDLESAVAELCVRRMSRGGLKKHFSWSTRLRGGKPGDLNAFLTFKEHLKLIVARLQGVQVENRDVKEFLQNHNDPEWLIYVDPPYLPSTRRATRAYSVEMVEKEHDELLDVLLASKSKILLSGYASPLYMKRLKGWDFYSVPIVNHSGQNKVKEMRIECLWRNYV